MFLLFAILPSPFFLLASDSLQPFFHLYPFLQENDQKIAEELQRMEQEEYMRHLEQVQRMETIKQQRRLQEERDRRMAKDLALREAMSRGYNQYP